MNDISKEVADKKEYEIAVLLKEEGFAKEVLQLLSRHGVEVREEGQLRKIQLAYPVGRERQAHFGFFHVLGLPLEIKSLENDLRNQNGVLRSLIVVLESDKAAAEGAIRPRRPMMPPSPRRSMPTGEQAVRKTLSNEAIEKKIEEILR